MQKRHPKKLTQSQSNRSSVRRIRSVRRRKQYKRTTRSRRRETTVRGAQSQLKRFAQASILAVAITGFLLLLLAPSEAGYSQDTASVEIEVDSIGSETSDKDEALVDSVALPVQDVGEAAKNEALVTLQNLWDGFYANLPKILVALATLLLAWGLVRLLRVLLRRVLGRWKNSGAIITLITISVWLLAIGLAISVVVGDIRALVGSLGLVGLALSWSLQTPIESFTGWLLNSFQGYY